MKKRTIFLLIAAIAVVVLITGMAVVIFWSVFRNGDSSDKQKIVTLPSSESSVQESESGARITYVVKDAEITNAADIEKTANILFQRANPYNAKVVRIGIGQFDIYFPETLENLNTIAKGIVKSGEILFLDEDNYTKFLAGDTHDTELTNADIQTASAEVNNSGATADYVVRLKLTDEGKQKFKDATVNNIGKRIYIIYNDEALSSPTIAETITEGEVQITGMEDLNEAESLATILNTESLPLELYELSYDNYQVIK